MVDVVAKKPRPFLDAGACGAQLPAIHRKMNTESRRTHGPARSPGHLNAMEAPGAKRWIIAEGYIPPQSTGASRELTSHEAACILNASSRPAHIRITLFFSDKDPVGPYEITIEPRRTKHVRFNDLTDPQPVPKGTEYSSVIESDVPVVVQHTRLDSRHPAHALLSTMAFPC